MKLLLLSVIICFACNVHAQFNRDTVRDSIMKTDCDGIIFTKMENRPSVRNGIEGLADSIAFYLKKKSVFTFSYNGQVKFVLTSKLKIVNFQIVSGDISDKGKNIKAALEKYAAMWNPAIQNSHIVCAYVILNIVKDDNGLHLSIE